MAIQVTSEEFNKRFNAWLRIEPRCRQQDFTQGIEAKMADPLWLLARQWQTGELLAEDAGSPVRVELQTSTQSMDTVKLGDAPEQVLAQNVPLEKIIEQEQSDLNYRERVRVGQEFERRLRSKVVELGLPVQPDETISALRSLAELQFPNPSDPPLHTLDIATQHYLRFMQNQVVDGRVILNGQLPTGVLNRLSFNRNLQNLIEQVRREVVAWYDQVCATLANNQSPAWQSPALQYRFEANSGNDAQPKTHLTANDYRNGDIDWQTFSVGSNGVRGSWQPEADFDRRRPTPTRIQITGTSPRWWAFENGKTNFGKIDVAKPDLVKLMLMEYVLVYGDDWYSLSFPVGQGSLASVDSLRVYDTFNGVTDVEPPQMQSNKATERFELFTLSPDNDPLAPGLRTLLSRPILLVPPLTGFRQESPVVDEVRFLRDEGANMLFGVEHLATNGIGRPTPVYELHRDRLQQALAREQHDLDALIDYIKEELKDEAVANSEEGELLTIQLRLAMARLQEVNPNARPTPSQGESPRYRLATTVPENWIPFIPTQKPDETLSGINVLGMNDLFQGIDFRRARMLRNTEHVKLSDSRLTLNDVQTTAEQLDLPSDTFNWMAEPVPPETVASKSKILSLEQDPLLWLHEETVPHSGVRVQLIKQRARWTDGSTHVWLGRKVLTGRGEGASGLKFDPLGYKA